MINKITITASDGKVITGTLDNYATLVSELNAYEADLKLKKEKAEAEWKRMEEERTKALAKEKKLTELKQKINVRSKELDGLLDEYEKVSGKKYYYYYTGNEYSLPILLNEFINRIKY
jgi:lipid II:glycine glycyltransferase (peptidoglycan interpeptide bridge formation enzyme)